MAPSSASVSQRQVVVYDSMACRDDDAAHNQGAVLRYHRKIEGVGQHMNCMPLDLLNTLHVVAVTHASPHGLLQMPLT